MALRSVHHVHRAAALLLVMVCLFNFIGETQTIAASGDNGMLMPFPEDGSAVGSGDNETTLPPLSMSPTCHTPLSQLRVTLYNPILSQLNHFECTFPPYDLKYMLTLPSEEILTIVDNGPIFVDYFGQGVHTVNISVCSREFDVCDESTTTELGQVMVTVGSYSDRLFPYGEFYGDSLLTNALDRAALVSVPQGIPLWSNYHYQLYVSTNGLVSMDRPYLSWWPVPFPFARVSYPIIAPYWTDFDFRWAQQDSGVYYHVYDINDETITTSRRTESLLQEFGDRLSFYSGGGDDDGSVNFSPEWMVVFTWSNAIPYYGRYNLDETTTFQLVLATDYTSTYGFYLYGDTNWNIERRAPWQRIVVGHDARDFVNYENIVLQSNTDLFTIDDIVGNSNLPGVWYFNFTSSDGESDMSSEQRCLEWSKRQRFTNSSFDTVPSACPCTRRQAWRDWRFWFAHFWGLSSRPNCATLLWSRQQSTIECCYDNDGSLIVGANDGGSYLLYNPLFHYTDNFREDTLPYRHCCLESTRCQVYYKHRPSDDCSTYVPLRPWFMFGDPHFNSVDKNNFTFNGIGEYTLLKSIANELTIQARLIPFTNANGTVLSAVALRQGTAQVVQVEAQDKNLVLYINGDQTALPSGNTVYIVTSSGIMDDLEGGLSVSDPSSMASSTDQVFIRTDDSGSVILTTPSEASIMISLQDSFLSISTTLSEVFMDATEGLLGVFNGNPADDFKLPNGTILSNMATEMEIYYQFGLPWHVPSSSESIFTYNGNTNYSTFNDGYESYMPGFLSDLETPADAEVVCGGDLACIYDYAVTGNSEFGASTHNVAMQNQDIETTLTNRPPNITGPLVLSVSHGSSSISTYMYNVVDPDDDPVMTFELKDAPSWISFHPVSNTGSLSWSNPDYTLPSGPVQLFANDSKGASSTRRISIILCACINNGTCVDAPDSPPYNANGHYKQLCDCPQFFGGDSCEIEMRGCNYSVCPDYSVCVDNSTVDEGYTCSGCIEGYEVLFGMEKCVDIDECNTTNIQHQHDCTQLCNNTEGSYTCSCENGYRLTTDGRTCEDVNECIEGTDTCSQICTNTNGSYVCSCIPGYQLNGPSECELSTCTNSNPCDPPLMCGEVVPGEVQCLCPSGQQCTGICSGSTVDVMAATQSCSDCTGMSYGYNCAETCSCANGGTCDNVNGCVCVDGWSGINCDIEVNNYSPVFDSNTPSFVSVRWNLTSGSTIVRINATDRDVNPNSGRVIYSLGTSAFPLPSGTSDGRDTFTIDSNTGTITLRMDLRDRIGTYSQFILTIVARDDGTNQRSATTTMTIVPFPVPELSVPSVVRIDEESPLNTTIANVSCIDIGRPNGQLTVTLLGNSLGLFVYDPMKSAVVVAKRLDYETLTSPVSTLQVVCRNLESRSDTQSIQIEILPLDDNELVFSEPVYAASIPENATVGTTVLNISAVDADEPNATVIYSILNPNASFIITPQGMLQISSSLDQEEVDFYALEVRGVLSTNTSNNATVNVNITILDINDEPPVFVPSAYVVGNITTMNGIGDHVVTVFAEDRDLDEAGRVTYQLLGTLSFYINETTGAVYMNTTLLPHEQFELQVQASDNGDDPLSSMTTIYITVRPFPIEVRFTQRDFMFEVFENVERGRQVGQVETYVIDYSNTTLNYSQSHEVRFQIVNGTDTSLFTISSTTGEMFLLSDLDYESGAQRYVLTVQAYIENFVNDTDETFVTIRVIDVNDNPPRFVPSFYAIAVEEFTPANTTILSVNAMDIDSNGSTSVTYSLQGVDSGPFQIDPIYGGITNVRELTTSQDYRFFAVASDGTLSSQAVVFISVTRSISITPTFSQSLFVFNISENVRIGSPVGSVEALTRGNRSATEFPHLRFRVAPDYSSEPFHIDPVTGQISTLRMLDIESQRNYMFYVEVYNADNTSIVYDNTTVEVQLLDVNDNSPTFEQPLYTRVINSTAPMRTVILRVSAIDRDSGTNAIVEYSLSPLMIGFSIDSKNGELFLTNSTSLPGDYHLTVVATDSGMPPRNDTTTVFVAITQAAPERIDFTKPEYYFEVPENALPNTLVGIVTAVHTDLNVTLSSGDVLYSTRNLTLQCLSVDPVDGEIRVSCSLDRETVPRYELLVTATVGDTVGSTSVIVNVLDINDNAPEFTLDIFTEIIDDQYGNQSPILNVSATDSDAGNNGTVRYSLLPTQDNNYFRINHTTGGLFLSGSTIPLGDYRLTVRAEDEGTPSTMSSMALVLICVTRARPLRLLISNATLTVPENANLGSAVGTVELFSAENILINPLDFPNNLHFSIIGGDNQTADEGFNINSSTGEVTTTRVFDREVAASHFIVVVANFTEFGISETQTINIMITDENDEVPQFVPQAYNVLINDSLNMGVAVINVSAIDEDVGSNGNLTFTIEPQSPFDVRKLNTASSTTFGEIYVANTADLLPAEYPLTLTATDGGSPPQSSTASVVIRVLPAFISFSMDPYTFIHEENSMFGTIVGNVSIVQEASILNGIVYTINGENGHPNFTINSSTGVITNTRSIDRETHTRFTFNVTATLPGEPTLLPAHTTVVVTISDLNDNRPIFDDSSYSIEILNENVNPVASLVTVTARDADEGTNAMLRFTITNVTIPGQSVLEDNLFRIENRSNSGMIHATTRDLNIITYTIIVTASDMGTPIQQSTNVTVQITIEETVPDSIQFTQPNGYTFNISEYTPSSRVVGNVSLEAIPAHLQQHINFRLSRISSFFFIRSVMSLPLMQEIITSGGYDYENIQNFTGILTAQISIPARSISLNTSVNITIFIIDENDNTPAFTAAGFPQGNTVSHYEGRRTSVLVYAIRATDRDSGLNQQLVYDITNNDLGTKFTIDRSTGDVTAAAGLDREERDRYDLNIRVCDMGTPQRCTSRTLRFMLLDINDNVPRLTSGFVYRVRERLPAGTNVFNLTANDPDIGANGTIVYRYDSSNPDILSINLTSGTVTLTRELDYEQTRSYNLRFTLHDRGQPPQMSPYTNITLQVINEPDNRPAFVLSSGETIYHNSTSPTVQAGETLAQLRARDDDTSDVISYTIINILHEGNGNRRPSLGIDRSTGRLFSVSRQTFNPEANFSINVTAYDNSRFNLSVSVIVNISVIPERLLFTQNTYSHDISEDTAVGSVMIRLPIRTLSVSSNIQYTTRVTSPAGQASVFSGTGDGQPEVTITLDRRLDYEVIQSYTILVTAERSNPADRTTATVTIRVTDVNDNPPVFYDTPNMVFEVEEGVFSRTVVGRVNASDADSGNNGRLQYAFFPRQTDLPFAINPSTGEITAIEDIDYEVIRSYNFTVRARDSASPFRTNDNTYIVRVLNINDNPPVFSALVYFGEVYANSRINERIHHTIINVTDADDPDNMQQLSFEILYQAFADQPEGFAFEVEQTAPHYIRVTQLPNQLTTPTLLELVVQVSDGGRTTSTPLYISVYTSSNIAMFDIAGVEREELLSCAQETTSLCKFLELLGEAYVETTGTLGPVSFYNNSVDQSDSNAEVITVTVFGWVGDEGSRRLNGEIPVRQHPDPVQYIEYNEDTFDQVSESVLLSALSFKVTLFIPTTELPTLGGGGLSQAVLYGIVCGGVVAALTIILIIVLVCVFGRRRDKDRPKRKKVNRRPSDPYAPGYRKTRSKDHRKKRLHRSKEDLVLVPSSATSAYETMYNDDDEILGTDQTMPWFDPKYLASGNDANYDGDTELTLHQSSHHQGGPLALRATVDGDARRGRRHSSDESAAESVAELEQLQSNYMQQYQQSTPMKPGERMGEFDMFASPRDDRPYRPSLADYKPWTQQHKTSQV